MAQLQFTVENQIITREDDFDVVAKSIYYLYAEFSFSEDWGNGIKTAQFVNSVDNEPYKVILDEEGLVPWEVLQYDNSRIKVSVFAGNRITTNEAIVRVQKSGYTETGGGSQPPTPGVYEQILKRLEGMNDADIRISSLADESVFASSRILEAVGTPIYIDDVTDYVAYGITEAGWYVFARIATKEGTVVTASTTVTGAAGYIATIGEDHIDVAVKFEVAAVSCPVTITWAAGNTETFVFKATDLAIRNLDYRVTFYVYDIDEFATWEYALTTDTTFADGKYYYTKDENDVYTLAEVTVGEVVPADTYYVHTHVTFEGMARNITYRCNTVIDCPMTFILPEIEDDCHGCWFEIRFRHAGSYSSTLVPPEGVKVATEHTQAETAGMNMVNLHYSSVGGAKVWRFMNTHSTIPA